MKWLINLGIALVLTFSLVTSAYADHHIPATTAAAAIALTDTGNGTIVGEKIGAFHYYTIQYPGNKVEGTLAMTFSPNGPDTRNAVGMTLWQSGSRLATTTGQSGTPGKVDLKFSSAKSDSILLQVYNYLPAMPVGYSVKLTGLPKAAVSTPAPTAAAAPAQPAAPAPISSTSAGNLVGSKAGSYANYTMDYSGDNSLKTVTLSFYPSAPHLSNAVFVNVYQNGKLLASGQGSKAKTPGMLPVTFSSKTAGPVLIQIGNYNADATISYTLMK